MPGSQDQADRFASFVMRGKRFDAPGLPGEAAVEITAYTKAIFAIAKQLWLDAHPDRSRVSPGVLDGFDLRLTAVEPGSTKPVLKLHCAKSTSQDVIDEWSPHILGARDQLTSAIRTLGQSGLPPRNFPRECLPDVARLGRSLLDNETVVVGSPEPGKRGATYTHELRETIRRIDQVLEPHERTVSVRGVIVEFDSTRSAFKLQSEVGEALVCHIDEYEERLAKRARDFCSLDGVVAADVEVVGLTTDAAGDVRLIHGVSAISEVRSVWEKVIMSRTAILRGLQDGWNGLGSQSPSAKTIAAVEALTPELARLSHSVRIGPTSSGAIAFEWSTQEFEYTAKLLPDMRLLFFVDNLEADEIEEYEQPFQAHALLSFLDDGSVS